LLVATARVDEQPTKHQIKLQPKIKRYQRDRGSKACKP